LYKYYAALSLLSKQNAVPGVAYENAVTEACRDNSRIL